MALPAHLLDRLPAASLRQHGVRVGSAPETTATGAGLSLGVEALNRVLPDHGLPRGAVIELSVSGSALGTSLGLAACRAAQEAAVAQGGSVPWCAFLDPSGTLYGPGVAAAGVNLERLLVVRPSVEALSRVALRIVESSSCAVTVIDTLGVPGQSLNVNLTAWLRVVRRLAMGVDGTAHSVILLTDAAEQRPLPLPVALRIELERPSEGKLLVHVAKDKHGRISSPRSIAWARSGPAWKHDAPQRGPSKGGLSSVLELADVRRLA
ncbi:MAG TPA: recombinase A [Polyangiaceae bacterium]|nr:recombinase A [Polyangiaceae bacterium]